MEGRLDESPYGNRESGGNVCVWPVPWGCGREVNLLCRAGWGNSTCPWVSGMVVRAGGGGAGGAADPVGPAGGGAPTGPGSGATGVAGEMRNMTVAKGVRETTRPRGMGDSGRNIKSETGSRQSTRIKIPNAREATQESIHTTTHHERKSHADGKVNEGVKKQQNHQQHRPHLEGIEKSEERRRDNLVANQDLPTPSQTPAAATERNPNLKQAPTPMQTQTPSAAQNQINGVKANPISTKTIVVTTTEPIPRKAIVEEGEHKHKHKRKMNAKAEMKELERKMNMNKKEKDKEYCGYIFMGEIHLVCA